MKTEVREGWPDPSAVRQALGKIISSAPFARAERMRRFLQFAVEQVLQGKGRSLKEYSIALNVYDKSAGFDPRLDPIVRVEASRLRAKLREYYDTEGMSDPVLISMPKRSYRPQFRFASAIAVKPAKRSRTESDTQGLYLKGRYYWNKRSPRALSQAIECFHAAVLEKPEFDLAWAGLGDCYASLAWLESLPPGEAWPKSLESAEHALRLNPGLAQARTTVACERALFRRDWEAAETLFREAIDVDDRYATAHHWYGMFCLAPQRRLGEALSELKQARDLEPGSAIIRCHLGLILYYRRQYAEAISELLESIKLDPTLHLSYWHLGMVFARQLKLQDAEAAMMTAQQLSDDPLTAAGLGYIHALMEQRGKAGDALARLRQIEFPRYVSPVDLALIETALGEFGNAFQDLQKAIDDRAARVVQLKVEPAFDPLKTESRFLDFLKDLGVSD